MNVEQKKIYHARQAIEKAQNELYKATSALNGAMREIRSMCKHDGESTYEPDPSGNNDSSRTCHICGADF